MGWQRGFYFYFSIIVQKKKEEKTRDEKQKLSRAQKLACVIGNV